MSNKFKTAAYSDPILFSGAILDAEALVALYPEIISIQDQTDIRSVILAVKTPAGIYLNAYADQYIVFLSTSDLPGFEYDDIQVWNETQYAKYFSESGGGGSGDPATADTLGSVMIKDGVYTPATQGSSEILFTTVPALTDTLADLGLDDITSYSFVMHIDEQPPAAPSFTLPENGLTAATSTLGDLIGLFNESPITFTIGLTGIEIVSEMVGPGSNAYFSTPIGTGLWESMTGFDEYSIPVPGRAANSTAPGILVDVAGNISLEVATETTLGGLKIGDALYLNTDNKLSADTFIYSVMNVDLQEGEAILSLTKNKRGNLDNIQWATGRIAQYKIVYDVQTYVVPETLVALLEDGVQEITLSVTPITATGLYETSGIMSVEIMGEDDLKLDMTVTQTSSVVDTVSMTGYISTAVPFILTGLACDRSAPDGGNEIRIKSVTLNWLS